MALAPNGQKRITLTISFPFLAKSLVGYGSCIAPGLGEFSLTDDGKVEFTPHEDLYEDIATAREIAEAEAKLERERQARHEQRMNR